ncbi:GIY-YIG nuclease family protein [Lutibacter sp. TH_r2]|uniref:GIY-YIG nuclease family protein n=1 Tax=Lutibacter sp. TH_r2 TaxID=3082083 RepID=UPI002952C842|nr:GIY-YIG nuclease family protein [Lutibacter sp. TH_r2]MDV7188608.1 GIY-YIG nuclease family protein [Lutibacter sp. TH_r2]
MGKKLTIYMIDGTEYGPRIAEIGNWVGKAFYAPRTTISKVINREEFDNPGIYCLKSNSDSESYQEKIYIGEAENIKNRIKQHLQNSKKEFVEMLFFISKDDLLTKTQIKYLESRIVQLAIDSKAAEIENGNIPSLPTLHEADKSDMEYFLDQMKLILPVMGFRFLISSVVKQPENESNQPKQEKVLLSINSNKINAKMYINDQGFIVEKGSQAKKTLSKSCTITYRKLRQKLLDTQILKDSGEYYEFVEDTIFSSASAASNMILGRNSNGYTEWISENGTPLKNLEEN